MHSFPIDKIKNEILDSLESFDFLLIESTPGSGKTTRVPLFLREIFHNKILILEPRKLAASLASKFVAESIGENVGESVGHIFRFENKTSAKTKIIYLTEGTFIRIMNDNPTLDGVDVVILDEFHERHHQTDTALAYLLKLKEKRESLKIVIMSATIDLSELEKLLGPRSKVIKLDERKFQLEIKYLPNNTLVLKESLEKKVLNAINEVSHIKGNYLVFLAGMAEIKRCEEMLKKHFDADIIVLHSEVRGLSFDSTFYQYEKKRFILSTNIAESSVTIPGVTVVIDAGFHKQSRVNPVSRLPIVETRKISQSSAIQRANRAARESNGLAYRLYSEMDYQSRSKFDQPEILRIDLSEFYLTTLGLFDCSIENLKFLNPLDKKEIELSAQHLRDIEFIAKNNLTEMGNLAVKTPFPPRISRILFEAQKYSNETFNLVSQYMAQLIEPRNMNHCLTNILKFFSCLNKEAKNEEIEKIILFGFVDQIARYKNGKFFHRNGEVFQIDETLKETMDTQHDLWILLDLGNNQYISRALPIEVDWLYDLPVFPFEENIIVDYDPVKNKILEQSNLKIGSIVLEESKKIQLSLNDQSREAMLKNLLPLMQTQKETSQYFQRLYFLEKYVSRSVDDFKIHDWLGTQLDFILMKDFGSKEKMTESLIEDLSQEIFREVNVDGTFQLERDLPLFLQLHDKRSVAITYDKVNGIHVESYLQDFFGLESTPKILQGKEKLTIHLLGPHKRALQITQDLNSFWSNTYKTMVSELKREYPRHYWPDTPAKAKPILLLRNVPQK